MGDVLGVLTLIAPVVVTLGFPLVLARQVLGDLLPVPRRPAPPTRVAGISATAQAVLGLGVGTVLTRWDVVPVTLWWLATWVLAAGVTVLVMRWPALRPTGPRPRREGVGAGLWSVAALLLAVVAVL